MEETKPNELLLYSNTNALSEQYINGELLANNKFNRNIIKDIKNYYETETENCKKKLSKYKFVLI